MKIKDIPKDAVYSEFDYSSIAVDKGYYKILKEFSSVTDNKDINSNFQDIDQFRSGFIEKGNNNKPALMTVGGHFSDLILKKDREPEKYKTENQDDDIFEYGTENCAIELSYLHELSDAEYNLIVGIYRILDNRKKELSSSNKHENLYPTPTFHKHKVSEETCIYPEFVVSKHELAKSVYGESAGGYQAEKFWIH